MAAGLAIKKNYNNIEEANFNKSLCVEKLVEDLFEADNKTRIQIENDIVSLGKSAVSYLVNCLNEVKGQVRGIIAMSLIRIGRDSILELKQFAIQKPAMAWVANYLISEIECKQH